jgi:hypothetical protein
MGDIVVAGMKAAEEALKEIVRESSFFCRKNVICYKKCVKET